MLFAERANAELHVLYADVLRGEPEDRREPGPVTIEEARSRLEALTDELEASATTARPIIKQVVERNFSPSPAILDYAAQEDIDLIVVGTHGRRGVRRLLLGSVAEEVVRLARCPVLTVRPPRDEPDGDPEIKSLLVPIDFSEHSRSALAHARDLAAICNARLELLHVVEEVLHPAFYGIKLRSIYDVEPDIEEKAVNQMIEMMESVGGAPGEVGFHAMPGTAAREIASYAAEKEVSMIVMGTHGLTGLDHFLMGSTTERVLRRAPCSVFAVKSLGKQLVD